MTDFFTKPCGPDWRKMIGENRVGMACHDRSWNARNLYILTPVKKTTLLTPSSCLIPSTKKTIQPSMWQDSFDTQ